MPELLVMRHAKSDWSTGLDDFDRPLGPRGLRDAPRMAQWLADNDLEPDTIVTSAAARTRATAAYVAEIAGLADGDVDVRDELYLASGQTWLEVLDEPRGAERLLICGHNPGLDSLVDYLAGGEVELATDGKLMTTAAIAHFVVDGWHHVSPEGASLVQLVRPRELPASH